jgi:hypothetical protein
LKKSKYNYRSKYLLGILKIPNTSLFNLGEVKITESENIVLGLGLKFLPKTQCKTDSIKQSLTHSVESFVKRIRMNIFFKDQPYKQSDIPRLLHPSISDLPTPIDKELEIYKSNIINKINDHKWNNRLTQLDILIRNNLIALANNKSIVIKPADKNLGTCIISNNT